ncbi:hypothetical protein N658DRAFT_25604 [Parathielavia hyrcaniae]|uniref:Uncharacterized protein n=1 Tax=Parathielavia hyrcaniae TaxID=113614 RepID=A0AAN6QD68_9PEZI|nr:hypothetical protein N658DRAFT_25604 [Parathielavia hyrcaniae]
MMKASFLKPPKAGRSRFSKALPAPPSLPSFDFESQLDLTPLSPETTLPRVQPEAPLPPIPPPKGGAAADRDMESAMAPILKPLNSPLPPGPPPMSIPRRPVASPPVPGLAPTTAPALASPEPSPSPVGSFSSLFSAYTAESPRPSPGNLARGFVNPGGANSVVSPNPDAQKSSAQSGARAYDLPPPSSEQHGQKHEPSGQVLKTVPKELPPSPPSKDTNRSVSRPRTPSKVHTQTAQPPTATRAGSPLRNASPQQEQLWRRRSRSLTGDKKLAVPDLKLTSSHGSTAASAQDTSQSNPNISVSYPIPAPPPSNPRDAESAPGARAPPRAANVGLPGRNIRPVASSEQAAPRDETMGQEASRIRKKLSKVGKRRGSADEPKLKSQAAQVPPGATAISPLTPATVSPVSANRPPTPEYGTNDVKSPVPETIVSPLSPASSPGLPDEPQPVTRRPIGASLNQIRPVKSTPALAPGPINTALGVRAPAGLPTNPRPDGSQGPSETVLAAPGPNPSATQPQYRAYSPAPDQNRTPIQKQYIPYSPAPDRNPGPDPAQPPAPPSSRDEDPRQPVTTAPPKEHSFPAASQPNQHQNSYPRLAAREQRPRTVSDTGSVETVKPTPAPAPPSGTLTRQPPQTNPPILEDLPLREPNPHELDSTTNPGALRFPRGWYKSSTANTAMPHSTKDDLHHQQQNQHQDDADAIPDARPLTSRQYSCLTAHRYMTANRQRTNPVACRTCGHRDRFAECYICSACYLNVCAGCAGLLRRFKGDLRAVVREVEKVEEGGGVVVAEMQG